VDVREKYQLDVAEQVAKVRARARPWRSYIALVLAAIAAAASVWAADQNHGKDQATLAGQPVSELVSVACAVAFGLLALAATMGLSGKARETLEPGIGSAHAAVVRYAIVLVGGLASLLITLTLLRVHIGNLILGGAFTAVLIGIAAQQTLSNVFAGIVLMLARPFAVGDNVRMRAGVLSGQIEGTVLDIGITYVRLDTAEGKLNVPNSQVLAAAVGPLQRPGADEPAPGTDPDAAATPGSPPAAGMAAADSSAAAVAPSDGAAPQPSGPAATPDGAGKAGCDERGAQR
jgi:small-conductance mechanosensitive channel